MLNYLLADLQISLRLAIRARFGLFSLWLVIFLVIAVILAAQFSGRQPATVALDVGFSVIRLALPLLIVLMAQELIAQEFSRRYFLTSITYPRPRHGLFIGRMLAIFILCLTLLVTMAIVLAVTVDLIGRGYTQSTPVALGFNYVIAISFVLVDMFVVCAMGAFFAVVAVTPSFIIVGTVGLLIAARSYSGIIALLQNEYVVDNPQLYQQSLGILRFLLPDLGALDVRMIALYGKIEFLPEHWLVLICSSILYGFVLIGLAAWLLQRKRFS